MYQITNALHLVAHSCSTLLFPTHPSPHQLFQAMLTLVFSTLGQKEIVLEFNLATCNAWRNGAWIVEGMATSLTCMATSLSQKQSNSSTSQQAHAWVGKAEWLILANTCCNTKICIHTCIYIYTYIHIYALPKRIETYLCLFGCGVCFQVVPLPPPHHFQHVFFMRCGCACYANYCGKLLWHIPFAKEQNHYPLWHVPFVKEQNHHPLWHVPFVKEKHQNCQLVWSIVVITPFCQGCFLHFFATTTFCQGK